MTAEWHYARGKEKVGPVTAAQLKQLVRSGELTRNDMVWKEGMAKWTPAGQVKGLFDDAPSPVRNAAPPPLPEAATEAGTEAVALVDPPAVRSPAELKLPVAGMLVVSGLALLFGLIGVLQADSPVVRILLAVGLAHNVAAVILAANIVRLRNFGLASLAPWVVMTCWTWHWLTNVTHGMTLLGMALAISVGVWAYLAMRGKDVRRAFEADPPLPPLFLAGTPTPQYALDPGTRFPWPVEERSASNPKLLWLKVGIGASVVVGVLCLASIVGAIFCLPFFSAASLIYSLALRTGRLHGRWVPVEGKGGWAEFVSGGIFKREDGTVGTFAVLPNQKFIDILASGHLVDSWRVLAWGVDTLEVQDMAGVVRNFKKGKTLAEKQASVFHSARTDHLPGSWLPAAGSGEWVQFTDDGAVVFGDGRAGRYTVTGEEPNEVIRVKLADGSASEYRVLSLSKTQLVIVEGTQARTYTRNAPAKAASSVSGAAHGPSDPPQTEEAPGSAGAVVSGVWNWLAGKEPCPGCKSRNTSETGRTLQDERQEVRTDWKRADGRVGYRPQATFNVQVWEVRYRCAACGNEWPQDEEKAEMA